MNPTGQTRIESNQPPILRVGRIYSCRWVLRNSPVLERCGRPATSYDPANGFCLCDKHAPNYLHNGHVVLREWPRPSAFQLLLEREARVPDPSKVCPACQNTGWDGEGYRLVCNTCGRRKAQG